MKKAIILILLYISISNAYYISSFNSKIQIIESGYVKMEETIVMDFEEELHHGLFRTIPYKYSSKFGKRVLDIKVRSVTDENGKKRMYKVIKSRGNIEIKIGRKNKKLSGIQTYVITYTMEGVFNYFKSYDELWLEITGHKWPIVLYDVKAEVTIPPSVDTSQIDAKCFSGRYGSDSQNCEFYKFGRSIYFSSANIKPNESFGIAIKFPKGIIKEPNTWDKILKIFLSNILWLFTLLVPPIVFLYMYSRWYQLGRDPLEKSVIAVQYEPPEGLSAAEVGTLVDERADITDITSTLVDLAVRGYIRIIEADSENFIFFTKKDYALILNKSTFLDESTKFFERQFLADLFSVGSTKSGITPADLGEPDGVKVIFLSTLKNSFYTNLKELRSLLYEELVVGGYFPKNPETVRSKYKFIGFFLIALGSLFFFFFRFSALPLLIGFSLTGLISILFSPFMPRKTRKGAAAALHALGFKEFIKRAEKDRIKKMAKEHPELFEKYLPYAMVFGISDLWVESFEGIFQQPPQWFKGQEAFTTVYFIESLGKAINLASNSMTARPRGSFASGGGSAFGGGGFSGGGFGGGGGGAW